MTGFCYLKLIYQFELKTPLNIGTGTAQRGFIDRVSYRQVAKTGPSISGAVGGLTGCFDSIGIPIIPGSTIKGRLRYALNALAKAGIYGEDGQCQHGIVTQRHPSDGLSEDACSCIVCTIFGRPNSRRGDLCFSDAYPIGLTNGGNLSTIRVGLTMDRYRRVARDQFLYSCETIGGTGTNFAGEIYGHIQKSRKTLIVEAIGDAFKYAHALGFGRSRGLGWFELVALEEVAECVTGRA